MLKFLGSLLVIITVLINFITYFTICPIAHAGYPVDPNAIDGMDYDLFRKTIESDSKYYTLESALEIVPKKMFSNHVLVYRSRSLQESSYLYPRAIVFGTSGKFIFTFNGHEKQRGFDKLEIIQFREKENRFEFREIIFPKDQAPIFSEANPKKCLECHQSQGRSNVDPRPNWEPYNFWPGVYGSVDEEIEPVLKKQLNDYKSNKTSYLYGPLSRFLPQDMILVEEQALEKEMFHRFKNEIQPRSERYNKLPEYSLRNPLSLTKITAMLNFRRIARLAKDSLGSQYENYKYVIAGRSAGMMGYSGVDHSCGSLYFPKEVLDSHLEKLTSIMSYDRASYLKSDAQYGNWFPIEKGFNAIFEPLGISTTDWSMDFKSKGRFSFNHDRYTSPHDSNVHLREALTITDPELAKLSCKELKAKSHEALGLIQSSGELKNKLSWTISPLVPSKTPLLNRCVRCHSGHNDISAPAIPFDKPYELKRLLKTGNYPRGTLFDEILYRTGDHAPITIQMPPSGQINPLDRDILIKYLEELKLQK